MRICKRSCPSNRSPFFADETDALHDSLVEKSEGIPTEHKVGVFGGRRKTGSCGRSLHGSGEGEMMGVGGLGRQTVLKLK